MTKKLSLLLMPALLSALPLCANADEGEQTYGWSAVLNKAGLEVSSTEIKNSEEYKSSPDSKLSGDSETVIKGIFYFSMIKEAEKYKLDNNLFMEYGKTKLRPADGPNVENETADKILLSSDYARKIWRYWDADVGPFAQIAYQTEFKANDDAPRTKVVRGTSGVKMFDGKYIKNMYAALVGEYDFTYNSKKTTKLAYEVGVDAVYPLREGVDFNFESYFRDYVAYSTYNPKDFEYELSVKANMLVDICNGLAMGPYLQYFQATDRGSSKYGASTIIGVEGSYSGSWNL